MDITDEMRRALFEHTFGLAEANVAEKAAFLRRVGVPEEHVAGFCRPGLHPGMAIGGARPIDVRLVVEQVLGRQRAGSVTLRVLADRDDAGHLRIEVVEVGPAARPTSAWEEPAP